MNAHHQRLDFEERLIHIIALLPEPRDAPYHHKHQDASRHPELSPPLTGLEKFVDEPSGVDPGLLKIMVFPPRGQPAGPGLAQRGPFLRTAFQQRAIHQRFFMILHIVLQGGPGLEEFFVADGDGGIFFLAFGA